jgi:hypothetical protein
MAEIHYKTVEKKTFNPNKNYFEIEHIKIPREETEEEIALNNDIALCYNLELLIQIFGPCSAIGALIVLICFNLWIYGLISFVVLLALSIIVGRSLSKEGDNHSRKLYEFYNKQVVQFWDEATAEIIAHNAEQERIAEEWRAAHPFEEKIRAVLSDPMSSVDIAEMAYFFADKYLKEKLGD